MNRARGAAFAFGAVHVGVCAAGLADPKLYAPGVAADPRHLRVLAALDAPFAGSVAHGVLTGRPTAARLRVGALSDLARAAAFMRLSPPTMGRTMLVAASVAGATTATALSFRVD